MPNIYDLLGIAQQFRQNPMALLQRRYNIPAGIRGPEDIIQHLLNTNQISQEQLNNAMRMRNDPRIRDIFK